MRRAECARYQANSTVGVPAVARSQSISTTRSPSKPRLSPRRSPWISVGAPCARRSASASASGSRVELEHRVADVGRRRARRTRPSPARTASAAGRGSGAPRRPRPAWTCRCGRSGVPRRAGTRSRNVRWSCAAAARMRRLSLAREPGVRRQQLGVDVAHRDPRGVGRCARPPRCRGRSPAASASNAPASCSCAVRPRSPVARASQSAPPALTRLRTNAVPSARRARSSAAPELPPWLSGSTRVAPSRSSSVGGGADGLADAPAARTRGGAPQLDHFAARVGSQVPAAPIGPARALPLEAQRDAGGPLPRVPIANRSRPGPPEVRHDRIGSLHPPATGLVAGVQHRVGARGARAPATNPRSRPRRAKGRRERRPWPHATRARRACPRDAPALARSR